MFEYKWNVPGIITFTPITDIQTFDTRQAINKNLFVSFQSPSGGQTFITYIRPNVSNFTQNPSHLHLRIIQNIFSSVITALLYVRFDEVITDIKQKNVLLTLTSMRIYIYDQSWHFRNKINDTKIEKRFNSIKCVRKCWLPKDRHLVNSLRPSDVYMRRWSNK